MLSASSSSRWRARGAGGGAMMAERRGPDGVGSMASRIPHSPRTRQLRAARARSSQLGVEPVRNFLAGAAGDELGETVDAAVNHRIEAVSRHDRLWDLLVR